MGKLIMLVIVSVIGVAVLNHFNPVLGHQVIALLKQAGHFSAVVGQYVVAVIIGGVNFFGALLIQVLGWVRSAI